MLFKSCPLLTQWGYDHEEAFNTFMQYKIRVPVCGAIMLNNTLDKVCAIYTVLILHAYRKYSAFWLRGGSRHQVGGFLKAK